MIPRDGFFYPNQTTISPYIYIYFQSLTNVLKGQKSAYMSHVMRKPAFTICEQQCRRSACASAQSDQLLCFPCLDSIIPLFSISEISSLYLASVAEKAGLCLTWSQTPEIQVFSCHGSYMYRHLLVTPLVHLMERLTLSNDTNTEITQSLNYQNTQTDCRPRSD